MNRGTRRGLIVAAALAVATIALPAFAASSAPVTPRLPAVPHCTGANIEVWLGLNPDGAAAGTTFYPIEFTNDGFHTHTCYLSGRPGVFAINSKNQKIGPAISASTSGAKITLKPGQTAYTRIGIVQAGFIAGCAAATAAGMEVTPPGQSSPQPIFSFSFPVCKNKKFMNDTNLVAGVGIP